MDVDIRKMSITEFRETPAAHLRFVEETGAQLWLTRRGRIGCAVLPFYQVKVLDVLLGASLDEKARVLNREYTQYAAAKRVQEAEERARLARGLGAGGAARGDWMARVVEDGGNPWERGGVLVR